MNEWATWDLIQCNFFGNSSICAIAWGYSCTVVCALLFIYSNFLDQENL